MKIYNKKLEGSISTFEAVRTFFDSIEIKIKIKIDEYSNNK
jgi:hypothetical protein